MHHENSLYPENVQVSPESVHRTGRIRANVKKLTETFPDQGRDYHLTNDHGTGFSGSRIEGVNYKVGDRHYTLTKDDRVYTWGKRFSMEPKEVRTSNLVKAVKRQKNENEAIQSARAARAENLGAGDQIMTEIYRRHLDFTLGYVRPTVVRGQTFFAVGENDFYTFYLGQVDGGKKLHAVPKESFGHQDETIDLEEFGYLGDEKCLEQFPPYSRSSKSRTGEKAEHHYCRAGTILFSDDCSGTIYRVNEKDYVVTEDGRVYEKTYEINSRKAVTDPVILLTLKAQIQEDTEIKQAREALADEKCGVNPKLKEILRIHIEYGHGTISPFVREGVEFYSVGHNASHFYSLGFKDGKVYAMTQWTEEGRGRKYKACESISEIEGNDFGYVGHF